MPSTTTATKPAKARRGRKAPTGPTTMVLRRTGQTIPFQDVAIGQPFYSEGVFWTRTDLYVGTDLRKLNWDESPTDCYGSCRFGQGDAPMTVEKVAVSFQ